MGRILVIRSSAWEEEIMFPLKTSFCDWGFRILISGSSHTVRKKAFWDKAFVQRNEVGEKVMCGETTCLVFKKASVSRWFAKVKSLTWKSHLTVIIVIVIKSQSSMDQLYGSLIFWRPGYKIEKAIDWQPAVTKLLNFSSVVAVTGEVRGP